RRRDVDCLFKKGPVERIGFVEQRERLQAAAGDQSLDGVFAAGNEAFHLQESVLFIAHAPDARLLEQLPDTAARGHALLRIVCANHAAASRQPERLDDAGIWRLGRNPRYVLIEREPAVKRQPQTGRPEPLPCEKLASGSLNRMRRVVRDAEFL